MVSMSQELADFKSPEKNGFEAKTIRIVYLEILSVILDEI